MVLSTDREPIPHSRAKGSSRAAWIPVILLSLWQLTEIARPTYPLKIPLICSLALIWTWLTLPRKRWDPAVLCALGFVAGAWLSVPFSANAYSAFWSSYGLSVIIAAVAVPAAHVLQNIRQMRFYVGVFLGASAYVGIWAILHSGYGPAGAWGGQDENYVAAAMTAALPFAYFGATTASSLGVRALHLGLTIVYLLAAVIGLSRGGFLGIAVGGLFCFVYSPRKLAAIAATLIGVVAIVTFAPARYWDEIKTIGDTKEGTADHRIELWKIATRAYLDNPVFGVGPGNFRWRIGDYQTEEQMEHFGRSLAGSAITHSTYFEVLSESGTVGMACFLGMVGFTFRDLRRLTKRCDRALLREKRNLTGKEKQDLEWARAYALSFQAGLLGYLVCSAFLSTTYFSTIWVMCAASVALRHLVGDQLASIAAHLPGQHQVPAPAPVPASIRNVPPPAQAGHASLKDLLGDRGPRR